MQEFKFFQRRCLFKSYDDGYIYAGDIFYTINKFDMESVTHPGQIIPKYTITERYVPVMSRDQFVPDYKNLLYFKSEERVMYLKNLWELVDKMGYGTD